MRVPESQRLPAAASYRGCQSATEGAKRATEGAREPQMVPESHIGTM